MYLNGQYGNNLYMVTIRVFTTQHAMFEYLEEEREEWVQRAKENSSSITGTLRSNHYNTLHTFIPRAQYRFYEFDGCDAPFTGQRDDRIWGMQNIPKQRVAKWAKEWETQYEVTA